MKIREAYKTDLNYWSEMRSLLWPDAKGSHLLELKEYFDAESIDIVQAYVADLDGQVIGFLELNVRNFAEGSRNNEVPYIEAWYVRPEYQGKGYGKQLMAKAELWAVSKGYSELASDTNTDNEKSIQLHKQMGFKETERVVCFLKTL